MPASNSGQIVMSRLRKSNNLPANALWLQSRQITTNLATAKGNESKNAAIDASWLHCSNEVGIRTFLLDTYPKTCHKSVVSKREVL